MKIIHLIISNGYIPLIPIFLWNALLYQKLPPAFAPEKFNSGIPLPVTLGENIFRIVIFVMPLFLKLDVVTPMGKRGLLIFAAGCLLYFASWGILILMPDSAWSTGLLGFTAPAWTPIFWLIGIGLMGHTYYFNIRYHPVHFIAPAMLFCAFHITHAGLVYFREYSAGS